MYQWLSRSDAAFGVRLASKRSVEPVYWRARVAVMNQSDFGGHVTRSHEGRSSTDRSSSGSAPVPAWIVNGALGVDWTVMPGTQ